MDAGRVGRGSGNQPRETQGGRVGDYRATKGGEGLPKTPKDTPLYKGGNLDFRASQEDASFAPETKMAERFGWLITARKF